MEEESDTVADLRHEVREEIETVRLAIRNLMQLTKQVGAVACARDLRRSRLRIAFVAPSRPSAQKQHLAGAVLLSLLHCRAQPWTLRAWRTSASSCTTRSC